MTHISPLCHRHLCLDVDGETAWAEVIVWVLCLEDTECHHMSGPDLLSMCLTFWTRGYEVEFPGVSEAQLLDCGSREMDVKIFIVVNK